jgi:tRNA (uracil-5-)-methyltransferase TRM9
MNILTIQKLNQLNTHFYQTVATDFSQSRQQAWAGWTQLLPYFPPSEFKVADVGCGNGRFAKFLSQHRQNFSYLGTDNNQPLLAEAEKICQENAITAEFKKNDMVETLLADHQLFEPGQKFDVITLFGVLHHIPSFELRAKLLQKASDSLKSGGVIIASFWQFDRAENLFAKRSSAAENGINENELEKNDFFLGWDRGVQATRYCHLVSPEEIELLGHSASLLPVEQYVADGKNSNLNVYQIWQSTETKQIAFS